MFFLMMFLEQWLVLLGLLLILRSSLKSSSSIVRILTASAAGSGLGCLTVWAAGGNQAVMLGFLAASIAVTSWLAFPLSLRKSLICSGYLFALSALLGGIWSFIKYRLSIHIWIFGCFAAFLLLAFLYCAVWENIREQKDSLYQVSFELLGKTVRVTAYLDTGNFLYEPIEKLPVSVIEEQALNPYLDESLTILIEKHKLKDIRMIPYRSVGKEGGLMMGVLVTNMRIKNSSQTWIVQRGLIGLTEQPLSRNGHYQLLLHPDLVR